MQIQSGRVFAGGGAANVDGGVTQVGAVMVDVRAGDQWAQGSGRLDNASGSGTWQGQGSAGACNGTWVAQRVPPEGEQNGPIYNYAPQGIAPTNGGIAAQAAACAARFHSYNAATGTYLGVDGQRRHCP